MNILLTGGMGYIGSHTAVALLAAGHCPVLYDNLSNSQEDVADRIRAISGQSPRFIRADVRETSVLSRTLREERIEAVIHFAGLKAVGESSEKPLEYYDCNVRGTISLLEAMRDAGIGRLIFSSSATVYGDPRSLPLEEAHPLSVTNPYGRTKLFIEEILRDVAAADNFWRVVCLRYFNPAGAHESGLIGESPAGIPNNLMPYIAQVAAGKLPELLIFGDDYPTPDGTGVRDYIHVMDLAEGHVAALSLLDRPLGWDALNLGTGQGYSVREMAAAFAKASGREIPCRVVARRPGDVAACYANPEKARQLTGWRARRDLLEMCASGWRFQQKTAAS
ncbi:MAG: UDP-glucose 4-epimerase GalE [Zoogloeaceae bacterium]|jgi:UDP-glucose 4-epimerase|nr:UDP-glucose 4-epimerase GalE [Zoogloeaceae bacterium]